MIIVIIIIIIKSVMNIARGRTVTFLKKKFAGTLH
jgi:hypothetical protein